MIQINLLPVRQLRKRLKVRNEVAVYFAAICLTLTLIFLLGLNKLSVVDQMRSENRTLSQKKASYQPILDEIDKLKKDKAEQETKLDVIKELKSNSQITVHVLDEMAKLTPSNRLWLKTLTQSEMSLNISGVALDNATIAQFMDSITASEYFSGAELASSSQIVLAGAKLKSFSLKIGVTSPQIEADAGGKR